MNRDELQAAITDIETTSDLLEKAMKLAGVVTSLFRDAGWNLVVVGGSAVEFYTEGAYMSGDIDFCRRSFDRIPLRKLQDLMARLGGRGGPRSWLVAGLYVDLLGVLENEARTPCRDVVTPYGTVSIMPAELAVVERVLLAYYPQADAEARGTAKKMVAACLTGQTEVDWNEVERLAALKDFDIVAELTELKQEVANELKRKQS
jgi:hypothetical protein